MLRVKLVYIIGLFSVSVFASLAFAKAVDSTHPTLITKKVAMEHMAQTSFDLKDSVPGTLDPNQSMSHSCPPGYSFALVSQAPQSKAGLAVTNAPRYTFYCNKNINKWDAVEKS